MKKKLLKSSKKQKGAHLARAEAARKWRRKVLGLPLGIWLIGLAGTALAVAGFIVLLGSSGTVSGGNEINVSYRQQGTFTVEAESLADCDVVRLSPSEIQITASNTYPGGTCTFDVAVENGGAAAARLQAFRLDSAAGSSLSATVATCGQTLAALNGQSQIEFTLNFDTITAGQVINLNASNDGLEWVAAPIYAAGDCTQT